MNKRIGHKQVGTQVEQPQVSPHPTSTCTPTVSIAPMQRCTPILTSDAASHPRLPATHRSIFTMLWSRPCLPLREFADAAVTSAVPPTDLNKMGLRDAAAVYAVMPDCRDTAGDYTRDEIRSIGLPVVRVAFLCAFNPACSSYPRCQSRMPHQPAYLPCLTIPKMADSFGQVSLTPYHVTTRDFFLLALALGFIYLVRTRYYHGLSAIPGPFLGSLTSLWKWHLVRREQMPFVTTELHERYGPLVRIGPNHISASSAESIQAIHRARSGFTKVTLPCLSPA